MSGGVARKATITNRHGFIVEDGDDYIRVTLPEGTTADERRLYHEGLDEMFLSRGWRPHNAQRGAPGYCTCGTLTKLCDVARKASSDKARR